MTDRHSMLLDRLFAATVRTAKGKTATQAAIFATLLGLRFASWWTTTGQRK